ncbi:MAG: hypothetical protein P1U53_00120 [Sulfitobacter sp.]|nr:hypothetical protein [Sulfitobacter sp.]
MFKRLIPVVLLSLSVPALADAPVVENVKVTKRGDSYNFDVTISHQDTGWGNFADAWRIVDMNGTELGLRNLAHPHEHEQPFTRSLSNVRIPDDVSVVGVQTRDTVGGWYPGLYQVKIR